MASAPKPPARSGWERWRRDMRARLRSGPAPPAAGGLVPSPGRPTRVLAIDGGGIRGIIPAVVLTEIERRTGRPSVELFDLIAGTSTGAIIALALASPGPDGRAKFSAAEVLDLYVTDGPRIFSRSRRRKVSTVGGLRHERYEDQGLQDVLGRYLGDTRLSQALTPVLVPAYALEQRRPVYFKSRQAAADPRRDYPMRQVARASSAAPGFFEPELLELDGGPAVGLIDGGVAVVNPAMSAYAEALRHGADDVLLTSLGAGRQTHPIRYQDVRHWGEIEWIPQLLEILFNGMPEVIHYELCHVLGPDRYVRLQAELRFKHEALDDVSPHHLDSLQEQGRALVQAEDERIDALCAALTE